MARPSAVAVGSSMLRTAAGGRAIGRRRSARGDRLRRSVPPPYQKVQARDRSEYGAYEYHRDPDVSAGRCAVRSEQNHEERAQGRYGAAHLGHGRTATGNHYGRARPLLRTHLRKQLLYEFVALLSCLDRFEVSSFPVVSGVVGILLTHA